VFERVEGSSAGLPELGQHRAPEIKRSELRGTFLDKTELTWTGLILV